MWGRGAKEPVLCLPPGAALLSPGRVGAALLTCCGCVRCRVCVRSRALQVVEAVAQDFAALFDACLYDAQHREDVTEEDAKFFGVGAAEAGATAGTSAALAASSPASSLPTRSRELSQELSPGARGSFNFRGTTGAAGFTGAAAAVVSPLHRRSSVHVQRAGHSPLGHSPLQLPLSPARTKQQQHQPGTSLSPSLSAVLPALNLSASCGGGEGGEGDDPWAMHAAASFTEVAMGSARRREAHPGEARTLGALLDAQVRCAGLSSRE